MVIINGVLFRPDRVLLLVAGQFLSPPDWTITDHALEYCPPSSIVLDLQLSTDTNNRSVSKIPYRNLSHQSLSHMDDQQENTRNI